MQIRESAVPLIEEKVWPCDVCGARVALHWSDLARGVRVGLGLCTCERRRLRVSLIGEGISPQRLHGLLTAAYLRAWQAYEPATLARHMESFR